MKHGYSKELKINNFIRYGGIPPSWEMVAAVVKKSGLKRLVRFERVWQIPEGSLTLYNIGVRDLPIKYWHIFYDYDSAANMVKKNKQEKTSPQAKSTTILTTNQYTINDIKQRLQPAGR